jgi:hypothetical protein
VSSDAQQKEGTIESQVVALRRQIATAGHELVKEYLDVGELVRHDKQIIINDLVEQSIREYCVRAKERFAQCTAFDMCFGTTASDMFVAR